MQFNLAWHSFLEKPRPPGWVCQQTPYLLCIYSLCCVSLLIVNRMSLFCLNMSEVSSVYHMKFHQFCYGWGDKSLVQNFLRSSWWLLERPTELVNQPCILIMHLSFVAISKMHPARKLKQHFLHFRASLFWAVNSEFTFGFKHFTLWVNCYGITLCIVVNTFWTLLENISSR